MFFLVKPGGLATNFTPCHRKFSAALPGTRTYLAFAVLVLVAALPGRPTPKPCGFYLAARRARQQIEHYVSERARSNQNRVSRLTRQFYPVFSGIFYIDATDASFASAQDHDSLGD